MTSQSIIFVDVGFLYAVGARRTANTNLRAAVTVQYEALVKGIVNTARAHGGQGVLRTYWYDASKDGLYQEDHKRIGLIPGVKVRLGRINYYGEQKGVDLRLALDLVSLARTGAASIAYLISGDDDLTEAVEEAQALGMRVVLLAVKDVQARLGYSGVAEHLAMAADSIEELPHALLDTAFTKIISHDHDRSEATREIAESPVAPPKPEAPQEPKPSIMAPKPTVLAQRPEVTPPAPSTVVYSSSTSGSTRYEGDTPAEKAMVATAKEVAKRVAQSWFASTTMTEMHTVMANRPQLAPDIDRVLLKDCAQIIGEANTDLQIVRFALRGTFWDEIDELM